MTTLTSSSPHQPFSADQIREEKAMVCFVSANQKTKCTSPIWTAFRTIEGCLPHDPSVNDFPSLRKILAAQQNNRDIVVTCNICFQDVTKPLKDCLATCYHKQISNAKTHLRYKHPELLQELMTKVENKDENEDEEPLPVLKQQNLGVLSLKEVIDQLTLFDLSFY